MNVELRHLRVVVLVAEAGSVGRAARWLKVSQPSLTAQLKRIEAAFGGELFERSRTGVTPTALGRYAVDRARAILVDVDHLSATVSAMTAVESSAVRLGGFPTAPMSGIAQPAARPRRDRAGQHRGRVVHQRAAAAAGERAARLRAAAGVPRASSCGCRAGSSRCTVVESESAYVVMAADHPLAVASRHRGEIELADAVGRRSGSGSRRTTAGSTCCSGRRASRPGSSRRSSTTRSTPRC